MTNARFHGYDELPGILGADEEAIREAIVDRRLKPYLRLDGVRADWPAAVFFRRGGTAPDYPQDAISHWEQVELEDSSTARARFTYSGCLLRGWFRLFSADAAALGRTSSLPDTIRVQPHSSADVHDPDECFVISPSHWSGDRPAHISSAWFLSADVAELSAPAESVERRRWPWGDYTNATLDALAIAAQKHWGTYDPATGEGAPEQEAVEATLRDLGVPKTTARQIARILRADSSKAR